MALFLHEILKPWQILIADPIGNEDLKRTKPLIKGVNQLPMRFLVPLIFLPFCGLAQMPSSPQWGSLKPGHYQVGYTVIQTKDLSRTYTSTDGRITDRPMQIYVWYPTTKPGKTLRYQDYFTDIGNDLHGLGDTEALKQYVTREFRTAPIAQAYQGELTDEVFEKILNTPIPVSRNQDVSRGTFPLILHMHVSGSLSNSILSEYLASHGFIIASISWIGTGSAFYGRGESSDEAALTQVEDVALMAAQMKKWPGVDPDRIAFSGMFAQVALQLQMKEQIFRAIACTDCMTDPNRMAKLPSYHPARVQIPVFDLHSQPNPSERSIMDSLVYADRWRVHIQGAKHIDFYPFQQCANPDQAGTYQRASLIYQSVLAFFKTTLKGEVSAWTDFQHATGETSPIVTRAIETARPAPPTQNEFLAWLRYGNMSNAREAYASFGGMLAEKEAFQNVLMFLGRDRAPQLWEATKMFVSTYPREPRMLWNLNGIAYGYLQEKNYKVAKEVFQLMVEQYPWSPYAWDGWSDYCVAIGEREQAFKAAREAYALATTSSLSSEQRSGLMPSIREKLGDSLEWPAWSQPSLTPINDVVFKQTKATSRDGQPLTIGLWLPSGKGRHKIEVSEYLNNPDGTRNVSAVDDIKFLLQRIGGEKPDSVRLDNFLKTETMAYRDASVLQGKFPVILLLGEPFEHYQVMEALAGQGFVVATVSAQWEEPLWPADHSKHYLPFTNVLEYLLELTLKEPFVDTRSIAVLGHGGGIQAAAYLAMRRKEIKKVVNLDGGFFGPRSKSTRSIDYHPNRLTIPFLHIVTAEQNREDDPAQMNAIASHITRVAWKSYSIHHHDFITYGKALVHDRALSATHPVSQAIEKTPALIVKFLMDGELKQEETEGYQIDWIH